MGILNLTPDSFYDGGQYVSIDAQLKRVGTMISQGASIIDIGAVSTRPGAKEVCEYGEIERLFPSLRAIRHHFPDVFISIDTSRALVARTAIDYGADMINDISGGVTEPEILRVVAKYQIPFVVMHMQGTPSSMQENPQYSDVTQEVNTFFDRQIQHLKELGFGRVITDPGFGFGKTDLHNYTLLNDLSRLKRDGVPMMVGLSRKSMINRVIGTSPEDALNGTTVLNTIALMNGADILRVHDIREAAEAVRLFSRLKSVITG